MTIPNSPSDTMTPRERVLAALQRKPVDRIPYCEHLVDVQVAVKSLTRPEQLAPVTPLLARMQELMPAAGAGMSGPGMGELMALMGALDYQVSAALGRDNITFWGGASPFQGGGIYLLDPAHPELGASADGILKSRDDVAKMRFRDPKEVVAPAKQFLAGKGDLAACALIFLGIDPCWHSMGFETFCVSCIEDPGLVDAILGPISEWYAAVAEELCKLDFDFIWAADDIAFKTQPLFSPRVYRNVLLPHTRKVAARITKPWIYHSDGNLLPIWDDLTSQGMNAIHPLEAGSMDIAMLKAKYGKGIAFCGGVDLRILEAGTPEETVVETRRLIDTMGPGGGYLLCTSNSVTPYVRPENLAAMLATLREYGRYPLHGERTSVA